MTDAKVKEAINRFENQANKPEATLKPTVTPRGKTTGTTHNVLLLGESGVGKSTFINAIANYLSYSTLNEAKKGKEVALVGTTFMHSDNDGKIITIITREDDNESTQLGESATQHCKSYRFYFSNGVSIRVIDTPGISDTRGTAQDFVNFENTMKIIDACGTITAFCIVMKCNHTRMNVAFKECLGKLFLQLSQNIKKNIIFIFTNGKGPNYSAVTAIALVNRFLSDEKIGIKLSEENALCFENDTFNHLVLTKRNLKSNITQSEQSWQKSSKVCAQFVQYVFKLEPRNVRETISINKTRQLLDKLTLALVEITQHIDENLKLIEERKQEVEKSKTILELEKLKVSPDLKFETVKLTKPKLICTSNKCTTFIPIGNARVKAINNKTCCPDCGPLKHLLGHGSNVKFKARDWLGANYCSNCECVERDHRIVHIETRVVGTKGDIEIEDSQLKNEIEFKKQLLRELEERHKTYLSERHSIIKALVQFYYYLKENSMIKYSDFFKNVTQEKFKVFDTQRDSKRSDEYKNVLELYKREKQIFKNSLKSRTIIMVSYQDLDNLKLFLCAMKYNGDNIRKIYELLDTSFEGQEIVDEVSVNVTSFQL